MPPTRPDLAGAVLMFRVDADARVGTGHAMRCLALASGWIRRGGQAAFLSRPLPDGIARRVAEAGIRLQPAAADETANARVAAGAAALVIDGAAFTAADLAALAGPGVPALAIDDLAALPGYPVDLLLNQNLHARAEHYAGKTRAKLLLGPLFALLREDIGRWRGWRRETAERGRNVLLLTGGADPDGVAFALVEAAGRVDGIEARLVVGAANPRVAELREAAGSAVTVLHDVRDMAALFRWCDVAVSAGGSTVWELSLFSTPMLLGALNPSEEPSAAQLDAMGAARYLGRLSAVPPIVIADELRDLLGDPVTRRRLGESAGRIVDGGGVERVVERLALLAVSR